MSQSNQLFHLPDGRRLGYAKHGAPNGKPLFYFHGSPSSRLESNLYLSDEMLQSLNVCLITIDRPGMGLSDFQPNRRLIDWPKDVIALADHLNIERVPVLAYSLGGPYGMVCAYAIPERLTKVGILSGAALFTDPELVKNVNEGTRRFLYLSRENPLASRLFFWAFSMMARIAPNSFVAKANSLLPKVDRAIVVTNPVFQKGFIKMVCEAFRQGARGAFHESLLSITEYGFHLQDIQTPILLWHGDADQNIPVEMARYFASAVPKCEAKFYSNEGHLSLFKKNAKEIIHALVE